MPEPDLTSDDLYRVLGVATTATKAELSSSYRKLALQWHPDKNAGSQEAHQNFSKVSAAQFITRAYAVVLQIASAYQTLTNDDARSRYDQGRSYAGSTSQRTDAFQLFRCVEPPAVVRDGTGCSWFFDADPNAMGSDGAGAQGLLLAAMMGLMSLVACCMLFRPQQVIALLAYMGGRRYNKKTEVLKCRVSCEMERIVPGVGDWACVHCGTAFFEYDDAEACEARCGFKVNESQNSAAFRERAAAGPHQRSDWACEHCGSLFCENDQAEACAVRCKIKAGRPKAGCGAHAKRFSSNHNHKPTATSDELSENTQSEVDCHIAGLATPITGGHSEHCSTDGVANTVNASADCPKEKLADCNRLASSTCDTTKLTPLELRVRVRARMVEERVAPLVDNEAELAPIRVEKRIGTQQVGSNPDEEPPDEEPLDDDLDFYL